MMLTKTILSLGIGSMLCLALAAQVFAQKDQRAGTAGAQELLIPVGSVGSALGGANMALTSGTEAIHWNPAGAANLSSGGEVMISNLSYIAGIDMNYVAGVFKAGFGALGVSVRTLSFGDIEVTTNAAPDGTGNFYSPNYVTVGLTYARQMTDRINIGTNVKLISERVSRESATGVAFDFGVQYDTPLGVAFGIALTNIGPNMRFDGGDLEVPTSDYSDLPNAEARNNRVTLADFELPTSFEIGLAYNSALNEQNNVTVFGTFLNNNFGFDEYRLGGEYNLNNFLFLRGSYVMAWDADDSELRTQDEDFLFGPSFGGGIALSLGQNFNLMFDYAYRTTHFFDDNQWITLRIGF